MLIKVTQHQKKKKKIGDSCIPGWPWTCVAEDDPDYQSSCLQCPGAGFVVFMRCWDETFCMLGKHSTNWATSPASALLLLLCFFKEYNKTDLGMMLEEVTVKLKDRALNVACVWVLVLSVNGGIWALNLGDRAWAPVLTVWIISPAQSVDLFTEENWA